MSQKTRAAVVMHLSDGSMLTTWTSFRFRRSFKDAVESFSFSFAPTIKERDRVFELTQKGEKIAVTVDGAPQATCIITRRRRRVDRKGGLLVDIEAGGMLATAAEAYVDPYFSRSLQAEAPLKNVILEVLAPYGFTTIDVDSSANVTAISGKSLSGRADPIVLDDLTQKDFQAESEQSVLEFVRRLTTRYGVALGTNHKGGLMLSTPDYDQSPAYAIVEDVAGGRIGDRAMDGIEEVDTNEGMFSEVVVAGKLSGSTRGTTTSTTPVACVFAPSDVSSSRPSGIPFESAQVEELDPGRHTYRSSVHPFKPRYKIDNKSHDRVRCMNTAKVMHGARASEAYQVRCEVDGLISVSGRRVWAVDTIADVYSASLEIDEPLWVLALEQSQDWQGGQRTALTMIPKHSLDLR